MGSGGTSDTLGAAPARAAMTTGEKLSASTATARERLTRGFEPLPVPSHVVPGCGGWTSAVACFAGLSSLFITQPHTASSTPRPAIEPTTAPAMRADESLARSPPVCTVVLPLFKLDGRLSELPLPRVLPDGVPSAG